MVGIMPGVVGATAVVVEGILVFGLVGEVGEVG